ncbi:hypothetical protein [Ostreibacterium oceani]|uniref:Uncharacterized protein n=1 Tax=Ostreibacterium oceani TaxID=2654998 RepID=A0A6N7EWW1_9GAMM|nr:hypothetical protein [Ostreibacterium oceani]MPV87002.1 hypothetical protein [Ostreibacterium oceani]
MKNIVSITKAAKLAGVSRTTLYDKLNNGELSKTPNGKIDVSELLRVYPNIEIKEELDNSNNSNIDTLNTTLQTDNELLKTEIRFLKEKVLMLENTIEEIKKDKEEYRVDKKVFRDLAEQKLIPDLSAMDNTEQKKKGWFFRR